MRKTPASILLAAAAALSAQAAVPAFAEPIPQGGFQDWTTDQDIDEEAKPDSDLEALNQHAEQEEVCIPIGEGENCW